jgi:DamX protein
MNAQTPTKPISDALPGYKKKAKEPNTESENEDQDADLGALPPIKPLPEESSTPTPLTPISQNEPTPRLAAADSSEVKKLKEIASAQKEAAQNDLFGHYYTLQLMATPHFKRLLSFVDTYKIDKETNYFAAKRGDDTLYVLVYGRYASEADAQNAVKQLPLELRAMHPWIRSGEAIQNERRSGRILR